MDHTDKLLLSGLLGHMCLCVYVCVSRSERVNTQESMHTPLEQGNRQMDANTKSESKGFKICTTYNTFCP